MSYTLYPLHNTPWRSTLYREILAVADELQSTPPRGGRPPTAARVRLQVRHFNPHPRVGGDWANWGFCWRGCYFNPRPRVRGDRIFGASSCNRKKFQSTPPRGGRRQNAKCWSPASCNHSSSRYSIRSYECRSRRRAGRPRPRKLCSQNKHEQAYRRCLYG